MTLPDNGGFGFPDWLPLSINEIGLRFPDPFNDLLPPPDGDETPPSLTAKFALNALTNFEILFSGGVVGSDGFWPITFEVDDATVNVDLLFDYAKQIADVVLSDELLSNGHRPSQMMYPDPNDRKRRSV